jgi:hypothetical protein
MAERRSDLPVFVAGAVVMLMALLLIWTMWPNRTAPVEVVRVAASAVPDLRPKLPESPRLPASPILPR